MKLSLTSLFIFVFALSAFAQSSFIETIEVRPYDLNPLQSATIIHINENEQAKTQTVADVLRSVPGLEVVRQGGLGQTTSVFIRGARSEDTLVLIDGAEANDAMSPGSGFDFSTMSLDNVERIEVFRGPQSVAFGAGALGGVINIITKEGKSVPEISYLGEYGSFNTTRASVSASGKKDSLGYSASGSVISSAGFSAAAEKYGNTENDGALIRSGSLKMNWTPTETATLQTTLRSSSSDVDIDSGGGVGGDDPNNVVKSQQLTFGVTARDRFLSEKIKAALGFYYSDVHRQGRNEVDAVNTTDSTDNFQGENQKAQADVDWYMGEAHTLRLNISHRQETGSADSTFNGSSEIIPTQRQTTTGESLSYIFESRTWIFEVGARQDQNSVVKNINSQRISLGRLFPTTESKVLLTYGTGYKLPSLYQLYSVYGSENLKQESSSSVEATFEQRFSNGALILTGFENRYQDLIDFNMTTSKYFNLSLARSQGLEVQGLFDTNQSAQISGSFAYLKSEDEETGLKLIRRPEFTASIAARYNKNTYDLFAQATYRGERDDVNPNTLNRIVLSPYTLISVGGSYYFKTWLKTYARVENLTDSNYEEVAGYGTAGRSYYGGVTGDF